MNLLLSSILKNMDGGTSPELSLAQRLQAAKAEAIVKTIESADSKKAERETAAHERKEARKQKIEALKANIAKKWDEDKTKVAEFRKKDRENMLTTFGTVRALPEMGAIVGREGLNKAGEFVHGQVEKGKQAYDRASNKVESWKQWGREWANVAYEGAIDAAKDVRDTFVENRDKLKNRLNETKDSITTKALVTLNKVEDDFTKVGMVPDKLSKAMHEGLADLWQKGGEGILAMVNKNVEKNQAIVESKKQSLGKMAEALHYSV